MVSEFTQKAVHLDPYDIGDDCETVLTELIAEQSDELQCDDIESIQTLVLSADNTGLSNHAKVLVNTTNATIDNNE